MLQQTINGLAVGATYALLGLGVTMIWGVLRLLNFAYGQFIVWGTFATLVGIEWHLPTWFAVVLGMLVGGAVAVVVDVTVLRYMRRRNSSEFAMVVATIGVSYILSTIVQARTSSQIRAFPIQRFPTGSVHLGSVQITDLQLTTLAIAVVVMVALGLWLSRTRLGRATRAVAYSARTAELLGVRSQAVFALAVFLSGALAAVAGVSIAATTSTLSYSSGDELLVIAFSVIVLGRMGSVKGAVIGGIALGLVQTWASAYISNSFSETVAYLVILLILVVRPSGLFGIPEETRV